MRDQQRRSAHARRDATHQAGSTRRPGSGTSGRWLALAALLAVLALIGGSGAGWTTRRVLASSSGARAASGAAGAGQWRATGTRAAASWRDPSRHTAFALRPLPTNGLASRATAGPEFVFVLPDGSQVLGESIAFTAVLNQLRDLGPGDQFAVTQNVCTAAERVFSQAGAASQSGKAVDAYTDVGDAHLVLNIGQGGLIAYAGLSFTPGITACSQQPTWEMVAGCVGPHGAADCTPPAPPATAAASYGSALTTAVQSRDWGAIYALNSQTIQAQYSAASFADIMNQGASQLGRITGISAPLSTPEISYDSAGQVYFIATQRVTVAAGNSTLTRQISSYFLLEGGDWRFWFSV